MRQTFLSIFIWRSLILQWKTVPALSVLFSASLESGSGDRKKREKRLILLVSGEEFVFDVPPFDAAAVFFYFHHQPAHSFPLFPLFNQSLYLSSSSELL